MKRWLATMDGGDALEVANQTLDEYLEGSRGMRVNSMTGAIDFYKK